MDGKYVPVRVLSGDDLLNTPIRLAVAKTEAAPHSLRGENTNLLLPVAGRLGSY